MQTAIGHTISDLHLLTTRSSAAKMMPSLHHAASEAGLFVLNGDIFDFQWSFYPDFLRKQYFCRQKCSVWSEYF
jgi:UDP-2,3-diacylglucosamine pyrophosphatase LpxH